MFARKNTVGAKNLGSAFANAARFVGIPRVIWFILNLTHKNLPNPFHWLTSSWELLNVTAWGSKILWPALYTKACATNILFAIKHNFQRKAAFYLFPLFSLISYAVVQRLLSIPFRLLYKQKKLIEIEVVSVYSRSWLPPVSLFVFYQSLHLLLKLHLFTLQFIAHLFFSVLSSFFLCLFSPILKWV